MSDFVDWLLIRMVAVGVIGGGLGLVFLGWVACAAVLGSIGLTFFGSFIALFGVRLWLDREDW